MELCEKYNRNFILKSGMSLTIRADLKNLRYNDTRAVEGMTNKSGETVIVSIIQLRTHMKDIRSNARIYLVENGYSWSLDMFEERDKFIGILYKRQVLIF